MASTKEYRDFVLDCIELDDISYKLMMGEYLLYYSGILIGGIYDDRLLVKIVDGNKKYDMKKVVPYDGAKDMYLVSDVDNRSILREIILDTYNDLVKDRR